MARKFVESEALGLLHGLLRQRRATEVTPPTGETVVPLSEKSD